MKKKFDKKKFIAEVKDNVKTLYRKNLDEATQEQIFQAVSYAAKDTIIDNWLETQEQYEKQNPKIVYYMSMEFLMGRALGNNLINLCEYDEVKEALEEIGLDLNVIEDRSRMRLSEMEVWEGWQHVCWILWQLWDMIHTAAVSVTAMVCLSRKSKTVIRLKCRITG